MTRHRAKRLRNRDEIEAFRDGQWLSGYVVGDPVETAIGVFVNVQTEAEGYLSDVYHRDIR